MSRAASTRCATCAGTATRRCRAASLTATSSSTRCISPSSMSAPASSWTAPFRPTCRSTKCASKATRSWSNAKRWRAQLRYRSIRFSDKFQLFQEQWQPKIIAELNDYQFKLVKLQGDFVWHDHKDTDEAFIVLEGQLRIDFRDGAVLVAAGEMFVVPRGVEHKPYAADEVNLLLIEPRGVPNTGEAGGERIVEAAWI